MGAAQVVDAHIVEAGILAYVVPVALDLLERLARDPAREDPLDVLVGVGPAPQEELAGAGGERDVLGLPLFRVVLGLVQMPFSRSRSSQRSFSASFFWAPARRISRMTSPVSWFGWASTACVSRPISGLESLEPTGGLEPPTC